MRFISKFQNFIFGLVLLFLFVFIVSYIFMEKLPDPNTASSELKKDPLQSKTDAQPFTVTRNDISYKITPIYNYELYGMVVSMGDNLSWFSRFKERDPLNINDMCVIWGSNIESGVYKKMSFKNEEFICKIEFNGDPKEISDYTNNHLSNNHLLADSQTSSKLYDTIRKARKGDQIHFKGYLANYSTEKAGVQLGSRGSSTTRTDTGNGACETVYVTDFEVIKKYDSLFHQANAISKDCLAIGFGVWAVLVILTLIIPNKLQRDEEPIENTEKEFMQSLPTNITEDKFNKSKLDIKK